MVARLGIAGALVGFVVGLALLVAIAERRAKSVRAGERARDTAAAPTPDLRLYVLPPPSTTVTSSRAVNVRLIRKDAS